MADMEAVVSRIRSRTLSLGGESAPTVVTIESTQHGQLLQPTIAENGSREAVPLSAFALVPQAVDTTMTTLGAEMLGAKAGDAIHQEVTGEGFLQIVPEEATAPATVLVTEPVGGLPYLTWPPSIQARSLDGVTAVDSIADVSFRIAAQEGNPPCYPPLPESHSDPPFLRF